MGFFNRFKKASPPPEPPKVQAPPAYDEPEEVPQVMPQVPELPVEELKARLERGEQPLIIDVREPWEYDLVHLPQARLIPMNTIPEHMDELDKDAEIVLHCHHGARSWSVAAYLMQHGFSNVKNLTGGIDAWARRVEPGMKTY